MSNFNDICECFRRLPNAISELRGSDDYKSVKGKVKFYQFSDGVVVIVNVKGLPKGSGECDNRIFGFHLHSGNECSGNENDSFANALTHYNPNNCNHPNHAGDFPVLFGVNGKASTMFLTDRFRVNEIINKTVIIHSMPDDFTTQSSGNSGKKIACGVVKKLSEL